MNESFGDMLRSMRVEKGYRSLRGFADRIHYSPAYLSEIERGLKPPQREFAAACDDVLGTEGYFQALSEASDLTGFEPAPQVMVTVEQVAIAAAQESTLRAAEWGARQISDASVEQVRADVEALAVGFANLTPLDALLEARRVRDLAIGLVGQTHKPAQTGELYFAAGLGCSLLSVASFDLAIWSAAAEQARAAHVYAELVDHWSLQAWARGQQALVAYWSKNPTTAAELAHKGLALAPAGTPRARLSSIAARAWSHQGDMDRAREMLHAAERERESIGDTGSDDLHDRLAGQFGWGASRQAMCAASAWLRIGDADRAAHQAELSIRLHPNDTTGTQVDMKASADLAKAELARGHLDAAGAALDRVWQVEPPRRRYALTSRLRKLAATLTAPTYRDASEAHALRERIESFTAESTVIKALNGGSPTPPAGSVPS